LTEQDDPHQSLRALQMGVSALLIAAYVPRWGMQLTANWSENKA
jgi:hypothetical protein